MKKIGKFYFFLIFFKFFSYVAFLSGLLINSDMTKNSKTFYALEKLANWLCAEVDLDEKVNFFNLLNK